MGKLGRTTIAAILAVALSLCAFAFGSVAFAAESGEAAATQAPAPKGDPNNPDSNYTGSAEIPPHASITTIFHKPASERIFVIFAPYLEWDDISAESTPNLYSILDDAGLGNVITRDDLRSPGDTVTANETALSLGMGCWVRDIADFNTMTTAKGGEFLRSTNDFKLLSGIGNLYAKYGFRTIAIGCSDIKHSHVRPAAALILNSDRTLDISCTRPERLLVEDEGYAFGVRTDMRRFSKELDSALAKASGTRSLVSLDCGDLYRAGSYRVENPGEDADAYWSKAIATFDASVGLAIENCGPNDCIFIVGCLGRVTQSDHQDDNYAPLIFYGSGIDGRLCSASLQRDDLVGLNDVTRMLAVLPGLNNEPVGVGRYLRTVEGSETTPVEELIAQLDADTDYSVAINTCQPKIVVITLVFGVFMLVFSLLIFLFRIKLKGSTVRWMAPLTRALLITLAAYPLAANVMGLFAFRGITANTAILLFGICLAAIVAIALIIARFRGWTTGLLFTLGATVAALCIDQLCGGPMASIGFLTYQPINTSRFIGIGNEGAGVVFGAWLLFCGILFTTMKESQLKDRLTRIGFPIASALILFIVISPWFGANFGVVIWGIVGALVAWWMFRGHRLSWKAVVIATACGIVALVAIVALEALISGSSHLGTKGTNFINQGLSFIPSVLRDLIEYNVATLVYMPVATIGFFVGWILLAYVRIRKPGPYLAFFEDRRAFKGSVTAMMIASLLTFLFEDSGILLPALILLYVVIGLVWFACDTRAANAQAADEDPAVELSE